MKAMPIFLACALAAVSAQSQDAQDSAALNKRLLDEAPGALRAISLEDFCVGYGHAIRMQFLPNGYDGDEAPRLVRIEAKRRKLQLNDKDVTQEKIRIGMSRCQLLAGWGAPREQKRSVGSWGEDIQHIYPSAYVYTRNGVVKSWQD
jgi:hypothetical protein